MPLSEREQQILDEIERTLYQEDPQFAREARRRAPHMDELRRLKLGAAIFVAGFVVLFAFFITRNVLVGALSFGCMLGGIVLVAGSLKVLVSRREPVATRPDVKRLFDGWERKLRERYKRR